MALFGYSLDGYLVARADAFDQRVAALILDDVIATRQHTRRV